MTYSILSLSKVYDIADESALVTDILEELPAYDEDDVIVKFTASPASYFNAQGTYPQIFYTLREHLNNRSSLYRLSPEKCVCKWDPLKGAYDVTVPLTRFGLLDLVGNTIKRYVRLI